jgi:phosphatidylinositol 3-kinase
VTVVMKAFVKEGERQEEQKASVTIDKCVNRAGLVAEDAEVFKSAQMPLGISFLTNMAQPHVKQADRLMYKYRIIFKDGDDIRQDQLVLQVGKGMSERAAVQVIMNSAWQMLRLMDRELKMSGLDLKLTPYRVIATSPTTGMVSIL